MTRLEEEEKEERRLDVSVVNLTRYFKVAWVPKDKVNFDNTLKPLIDLDGEVQWQYGVVSVR